MSGSGEDWATWLRGGPAFEGAEATAFDASEDETNARRLRVLLPVMVAAQAFVSVVLAVARLGAEGAARDALTASVVVHSVALVAYLALTLYRRATAQATRVAIATALVFLAHGAGMTAAHTATPGAAHDDYLRHTLLAVALLALPPRTTVLVFGAGLAGLAVALQTLGAPEADALLTRAGFATLAAVGFGAFLHGARRREFRFQRTIDQQARDLAALNADLEQRVAAQVADLVARAEEVERLNAQLREQVRDRSDALALALRRLADRGEGPLDGALLGERFRVGRQLAVGGMGAVYEGTDALTGRAVAIKVIRPSAAAPRALLERFLHEARAAATIDHPAVVRMVHVDIDESGVLYQAQELVSGETLRAAMDRERLAPGVAARVLATLADALAAAHAAGVVHRDVKPENVILTSSPPGLRLVDFGISKARPVPTDDETLHGDPEADGTTRTGMVLGTPRFMSPEQRVGASGVGPPTDLYALGVVGHLMFAGTWPGRGGAPIPPEAADVVAACLSEDPADRPSARAVADAMTRFADALGAAPLPVGIDPGATASSDDTPTSYPAEAT